MDSPDLDGLVKHFDEKVSECTQLLPFARLCRHLMNQVLEDGKNPNEFNAKDLPDLEKLTTSVINARNILNTLDQALTEKEESMKKQHKQLLESIDDATSKMLHLSSTFPVDFGKPTEVAKPKYGIYVQKPKANVVKNQPTSKAALKTNTTSGHGVTNKSTSNNALNKRKTINTTTVTNLPGTKTQVGQNKSKQVPNVPPSSSKANQQRGKQDVKGSTSRMTAATISSMQKSASKQVKSDIKKTTASLGMKDATGKGPAIPVRLTKKLLTMRQHQLNKMKPADDQDE